MFWEVGLLVTTLAAAISASIGDEPPQGGSGIDATINKSDPFGVLDANGVIINEAELLKISDEDIDFYNANSIEERKGCSPTISCTRAGGYCIKGRARCTGTVDKDGCKGGKKCKCCIPDETTPPPVTCPPVTPCPTAPGESEVTTRKPWVIEPWNENDAPLDEQILLKIKSLPVAKSLEIPVGVTGESKITTRKPWLIEPWNENDVPLNEQMLPKIKSVPVEKPKDQINIAEETKKIDVRQGCGGEFTTSTGKISHPLNGGNYGNNENCIWSIKTSEHIKITFIRFDLEEDWDFLYIRDGETSDSSLLGKLSGDDLPSSVETTQNSAFIRFTSDGSETKTGFKISWEPTSKDGCGGEFTTSTGEISHPLNDGNYGNNENCIWNIKTSEHIKITFIRFDLEEDWDFLYIRDGETSDSSLLGKLSGDDLPSSVETTQNSAFIRFTSDGSVTKTGFKISWEPASKDASTCQCGVAKTERIIGGAEVNPKHKYPWQVGLKMPHPDPAYTYAIKCGGSIINDLWILTAAHCIDGDNNGLKVLVGEHMQLDQTDDVTDTKQYSIKKAIVHPDYGRNNYDFGLIELTEAITFNSVISPICLPADDSETYADRTGTVTGWGLTTHGGSISKFLKEVQVSIYANDDCKNWGTIEDTKICASVGACNGDSGDPLNVIENGKYVQVGVVSYGSKTYGCEATEFPGIYARVSKVLPWITENTSNGNKCD